MSLTPQNLADIARARYNATSDNFFTDEELYYYMYEAQMIMAREARIIERVYTTASVASQTEYSFPTNAFAIKMVTYNGTQLTKVPNATYQTMTLNSSVLTVTGFPTAYWSFNRTFYLNPTPDTSADTIKVWTYNMPQVISATSTFEIPDEYVMDQLDFLMSKMNAKDKDFAAADRYMASFNARIDSIKRGQLSKYNTDMPFNVQDIERLALGEI